MIKTLNMSEKVIREMKCFCIRIHGVINPVNKADNLRSWFAFFFFISNAWLGLSKARGWVFARGWIICCWHEFWDYKRSVTIFVFSSQKNALQITMFNLFLKLVYVSQFKPEITPVWENVRKWKDVWRGAKKEGSTLIYGVRELNIGHCITWQQAIGWDTGS